MPIPAVLTYCTRVRRAPVAVPSLALLSSILTTRVAVAQDPVHHPSLLEGQWERSVQVDATLRLSTRWSIGGSLVTTSPPGILARRFSASLDVRPWLSASAGFGETRATRAGALPTDRVLRGAVTLQRPIGRWVVSDRNLVEQHRQRAGTVTSYRNRLQADVRVRTHAPLRLFGYAEAEATTRSSIPRVRDGWRRLAFAAGVRQPLPRGLSVEGYVVRSQVRGKSPGLTVGALLTLHLDARPAHRR